MSNQNYKLTRLVLNKDGARALLNSDDIKQVLEREAVKHGTIEKEYKGFDRFHVKVKKK